MSDLALYVLGSPRIELDKKPVTVDRNKAVALLVYLAITGSEHSRQSLSTLFWPEYEQSKAYAYLRRTLWTLHQALGEDWIDASRETISFDCMDGFWLDAGQFHELLAACRLHGHDEAQVCPACIPLLSEAVELYQDDFLAGFSLRDSPAFDEWQFFQADELRREFAGALERLAYYHQDQGNFDESIHYARRWLALDPLQEAAHRMLMRAYARAGQRNAALRQYQECERILVEELDILPQEETRLLYEEIRSGERAPAAKDHESPVEKLSGLPIAPPPPAVPAPGHNLPPQPTPFIGRDTELAEIAALLNNPDCRLITLTGPGGIGKTRLAIEAARQAASQSLQVSEFPSGDGPQAGFSQGVFFISLASLRSPEQLVSTIAEGLKVSFRLEEAPKPQLLNYLRAKHMLLVMDNFEQLVSGAELLSEILASAPHVKILVTSRERLNIREEWVLELRGMTFPESETVQALEEFSAVKLFLQHARRVQVGFTLSEQDKPDIIRICRSLEGMPLGIELAAVWVKMFSCHEIASRIERDIDFLATSMRDVPERHQSLRAVFEHSWKLLSSLESSAFQKLSVFRGPFRLESAEAVISRPSPGTDSPSPLMLLSALVDKSMLHRRLSGRYEMHELLKQYAAEKLQQRPQEQAQARDRHCAFFSAFLEQTKGKLRATQQLDALQRIEVEIEDIRSAWQWALQKGKLREIGQAAEALAIFHISRSRYQDGDGFFRPAAERLRAIGQSAQAAGASTAEVDGLLAFVLGVHGMFVVTYAGLETAVKVVEESLDIVRQLSDPRERALAERGLANLMLGFGIVVDMQDWTDIEPLFEGPPGAFQETGNHWGVALARLIMGDFAQYPAYNYPRAKKLRQEALAIFEMLGDRWGMALSLNGVAMVAYAMGDYREALQMAASSLEISKMLGDRWRSISSLLNLGDAAIGLGDYIKAKACYQESLALVRETGNPFLLAANLDSAGYVNLLLGDYDSAEGCYQESLAISRQIGDDHGMGMALSNLGDVTRARGDLSRAQKYFRDSLELFEKGYESWGTAICLKKLAAVTLSLGDAADARQYYLRALEISARIERVPEVLEVLTGMAELLAVQGEREAAVELLAMCMQQDALAKDARARAEQLFARLKTELPENRLVAAETMGKTASLDGVVAEILKMDGS